VSDSVSRIEWTGDKIKTGCVERSFVLSRFSGTVPGVLWSPQAKSPKATVLLFHGGSGHKRSERQLRMGQWLSSTANLAVVALDGPYHGDRVSAPMAAPVYQRLIADEGVETVTARLTEEWLEAVSGLADLGVLDEAHVSVFGMSMGARYGLPAAAALGTRLQCLVLGKFGLQQGPLMPPGLCAPELTVGAARAVTAPVLFHVQWDDVLFPRAGQFELFDAIASQEKCLRAMTGPHDQTRPGDEALWQEFLRLHTRNEGDGGEAFCG
jgi:pimeloyl-ACP methyl ester carboxylesterase